MKNKIRLTAVILLVAMIALTLSSCSGSPYDYDLDEYIKIGDYSQIKIDESQIDVQLEKIKNDLINAHTVKSEEQIFGRPLQNGDIAVVTYRCYTEDELLMPIADPQSTPTPVLEDTNCEIILGRGKYLPAFESGILSAGVSSKEHEWHLTLPSDFGISELAGKNVIFFVTVNGAYELKKPLYDNVFIAEHTKYSTVEEYEEAMREQARIQLIWNELITQTEVVSYPKDELNEHTLDFVEYYTNLASASTLTLAQYVERKFYLDLNSFHLKADEYSKKYTKEEMTVYSIARRNGLELTDDEYNAGAIEYAREYGYDSVSELESIYGRSFIKYSILKDRVMRYVTYKSLSSPDLIPDTETEAPEA